MMRIYEIQIDPYHFSMLYIHKPTASGISQGSVLDQFLFVIMIAHIHNDFIFPTYLTKLAFNRPIQLEWKGKDSHRKV